MLDRFGQSKATGSATARPATDAPVYIYFARFGDRIKVGASRDVSSRLSQLSRHSGHIPDIIGTHIGSFELEAAIHFRLAEHRILGEWYCDNEAVRVFIDRCLDDPHATVGNPDGTRNKFGLVARVVWPDDTIAMLSQIANADRSSVERWLRGEQEPPLSVILAVIHEMLREQTEPNLR